MPSCKGPLRGLSDYPWQYSYKTSSIDPDGRPVSILHDFYIPALRLSIQYDRVAGYFRSSSLAAASQGFSAFAAAGGKMRLVVGADLEVEDVAAILKGDSQRMADRLNASLGEAQAWPEDVKRGVELLSWMVANGILDVRVAFRVHKETGKPLPMSAFDDGYVHEKWAVFTDGEGRRIYISGSLNESKNALVHNAENIDVHAEWWGDIERKRVEEAAEVFEALWDNRNPYVRVMSLPEAVKQRLIEIGKTVAAPTEIDGTSARKPEVEPPSAIERLRFALIKDGPKLPGGRFVGMETVPIEPWPHQEVVARRLIETWPYSFLLCDEVGLGKTIEAGLAMRSLYLSGIAKRILIASPASLTRQWQREMASKFFLPFGRALSGGTVRHEYIFPVEKTDISQNLYQPDLCIVSTGLLSRKERSRDIKTAKDFDIVLVDEAHYARRKDHRDGCRSHPQFGHLYRNLRDHVRPKTRSLWMATATPMQLDWIEVFDLLRLTNRVGPFLYDPSLTWAYYEALGRLVENRDIDSSRWELLRRCINTLRRLDPILNAYLNEWVIDGRIRSSAKRWLENGHIPTGADRRHIQRLIFSAAPLCRVMLRHTRPLLELYRENGQLKANLARREILPFPVITMTPQEKTAYEDLEAYCRELTKQITANSPGQKNLTHLGFYLSFLRLRFASSLFAIRETLRRRKKRVAATLEHSHENGGPAAESDELKEFLSEDEDTDEDVIETILKNRTQKDLEWEQGRLAEMLKTLDDISGTPSKMKELLRVLDKRRQEGSRIQQTVIFTRFYDTLQDIVARLRAIDASMLIGTYSGKGGQYVDPQTKALRGTERDEIKHRFLRGEIDVLVCTDAAAEGLNLQTADLLINYDLPWNPMKVEQRIGRIDRIGQKYERIFVLNLCYVDSAEQIVYDRLLKRLSEAGVVVGTQQPSLLPVTLDEFCEIAEGSLKIEELEARAKERIIANRRRTENMEIAARDLYEIYIRIKNNKNSKQAPITLDAIWEALSSSKYLRDLGSTVSSNLDEKVIILRGFDSLPSGVKLTINRDIFERGMQASDSSTWSLHFATYGDGVFEALLEEFGCYELPPCAVRLSESVPDIPVEVIAYAVATLDGDGSKVLRLVASWEDLKGLVLDESAVIDPADLEALKEELRKIVRNEFDPMRAVGRIEKENLRAGIADAIWDLLVAQSLLKPIGSSDDDNFWATIKNIDDLLTQRDHLLIADLPVEILKTIQGELLADIPIPNVGDKTTVTVPIVFAKAGIDAGYRIADAMKEKKSELSLGMVQAKIDRELKDQIKHLNSIS